MEEIYKKYKEIRDKIVYKQHNNIPITDDERKEFHSLKFLIHSCYGHYPLNKNDFHIF